jgi:hypothetical protein
VKILYKRGVIRIVWEGFQIIDVRSKRRLLDLRPKERDSFLVRIQKKTSGLEAQKETNFTIRKNRER